MTNKKTSKKNSQKTTKKATKKDNKKTKSTKSSAKKKSESHKTTKVKLSNEQRDKQLVQTIIEGMLEKKARNITIMDLTKIENNFCNYFVICEADSKPQLQAITDSVEEFVRKKLSIKPHHTEGIQNAEWILIDYLTVIVHIFRSDVRNFYDLETLWADAKIEHLNTIS